MTPAVQITAVAGAGDRRALLTLPYRLYRNDPNWVPRIWNEQSAWLQRRNGFFEHGEAEWFLARRQGRVVGSIGAAVDHTANLHLGRKWGIFGFLEFVDDQAVFDALVGRAAEWLRARGMTHMLGPQSFGSSDFPGVLVGRFDVPPALFEGHTPPYYLAHAERAGWKKAGDALAYRAFRRMVDDEAAFLPAKLRHAAERVARNPRYAVRQAELSRFEHEFGVVLRLYNRSLSTLPDFVPAQEDEFRRMIRDLMPVLRQELVLFALVDGVEVGFSLALPNLAEAIQAAGGMRYPWQWLRFARASKRIRGVSFKILAMDPDYWGLGLDGLLYVRLIERCVQAGYEWMDMSLTGEDNPQTNRLATRMGAQEYKRYRTFVVEL